ncbi:MAG: hypothetical protein HKN87_07250 [Saprospiraceae bacterium]|nr:hypothetical protein [Saprospiraceae bacterium]
MIRNTSVLISVLLLNSLTVATFCQSNAVKWSGVRTSPVSYHLSFDDNAFFDEDIIEQSDKKSLKERKIDFPEGRFGRGIRMAEVPAKPDASNMTGIDLDLVTAVIFNTHPGNQMGFNQPFIWGSGRMNARLGSVAFWAKGELAFAGPLFEQTSVGFGRKERALLGIIVDEENTLSAYIRDARYVTHRLPTQTTWNPYAWNHVVLNWDWMNGMELWINGDKVASTWGQQAWFQTSLPGLFHMPAAGLTYDELYLFDRPIAEKEILDLMTTNVQPGEEPILYTRETVIAGTAAEVSGANLHGHLPSIKPGQRLLLTEVWPEQVGDECVPGWHIVDGRNEIAWPHPYSMFTIIPGDADFHAEKVDISTLAESKVNYVTLTGNLKDVMLQATTSRTAIMDQVLSVPAGDQFFYGSTIATQEGATFRIPFTEEYGTPEGFSGDINVPLSGEKRIQNIGLYHSEIASNVSVPEGKKLVLSSLETDLDQRTQFAIHALTSRDERNFALAVKVDVTEQRRDINIGNFSRLNIMTEPYDSAQGIKSIALYLPIKTEKSKEALFIRVRDPAVPSRLWNQLAVTLEGFDKESKPLMLHIDFQDIVVAGGDRIWIDVGSAGRTDISVGDQDEQAALFVEEVETYIAVDAYAKKEIVSAQAQYGKMYEFMPWQFTGKKVTLDAPYCYGGPFDMILPALAIHRTKPDHFIANYLIRMCGPDFKDGKPRDPQKTPLITVQNPLQAPGWALYQHDFNMKREAIVDWWIDHQNSDGQLGGGWNDDVLFLSSHQPDLPLDGNENARFLIDATHKGLEKTNYFKDGYCNIYPMDRMHIGDFISERYNAVVNNLGQAYAFERELESARRLEDPQITPINYFADGFKSSVNVMHWFWGKDVPTKPYVSKRLAELTKEFRLYDSALDDFAFYRFTESNVHRDDFSPYGANNMYTYLLGGRRGTRLDAHLRLAVMWPSGGGAQLPRVVLYADDERFEAVAYSFDNRHRDLKMRLCRISDGHYRIGIYEDPSGMGMQGKKLWEIERDVNRFDIVSLPIPPQKPVLIKVEMITAKERPEALPDLAVDIWDAVHEKDTIACVIHNLGNAAAENIIVRLSDGDVVLGEQTIDRIAAPIDFVAKRKTIIFDGITYTGNLHITIDPESSIDEILSDNNRVFVQKKGTFQEGLAPTGSNRMN